MYGTANAVASSADKTFSYIPDCSDLPIDENADYVYICENQHHLRHQILAAAQHQRQAAGLRRFLLLPVRAGGRDQIRNALRRRAEEHRPRRCGHCRHPGRPDYRGRAARKPLPCSATRPMRTTAPCTTRPPLTAFTSAARCSGGCCPWAVWKPSGSATWQRPKVLYDFLDASQLFHGTVVEKRPFPHERPLCHRECGAGRKNLSRQRKPRASSA